MERDDYARSPRADRFTMAVAATGCMVVGFVLALISLSLPRNGVFARSGCPMR